MHSNDRTHLQTEIAVCLLSVKYKRSSKEKASSSIPVNDSEQTSELFFLLLEAHYQAQACKDAATTSVGDLGGDSQHGRAIRISSTENVEMGTDQL